jgi:hypothetical protein
MDSGMNANELESAQDSRRQVYMVLSPRSLHYAWHALKSLLRNSIEPLHLHLITDAEEDCERLTEAMEALAPESRHTWTVIAEEELNDAEAARFREFPNLRAFRHGHPCWRKVTDPLLIGAQGEELVLLDPDLYFPNRFRFEPTPPVGLTLMWQRPNCLLPPEIVRRAMSSGIRLARHVDIGVSHWRAGGDLESIDWILGRLGGKDLPRVMHVEAIVWAAIAMHEGGGYLDPAAWVCWHRTQVKRLRRKLGTLPERILASEPWTRMKCFHAGGEAKWWIQDFVEAKPRGGNASIAEPTPIKPFVELTRERYETEQRAKHLLRGLGYYRVFNAKHA